MSPLFVWWKPFCGPFCRVSHWLSCYHSGGLPRAPKQLCSICSGQKNRLCGCATRWITYWTECYGVGAEDRLKLFATAFDTGNMMNAAILLHTECGVHYWTTFFLAVSHTFLCRLRTSFAPAFFSLSLSVSLLKFLFPAN